MGSLLFSFGHGEGGVCGQGVTGAVYLPRKRVVVVFFSHLFHPDFYLARQAKELNEAGWNNDE